LEGIPKLTPDKLFPIDCTGAGQTMITLNRFNNSPTSKKVAHWMIDNMQSPEGYFYYRKNRFYNSKTSFMRWSNAWMLVGLSEVASGIIEN
jgi:hypothetical protein